MVASYRTVLQTRMPAQFTTLRTPLTSGNLGLLKTPVDSTEAKRPVLSKRMTKAAAGITSSDLSAALALAEKGIKPSDIDPKSEAGQLDLLYKKIAADCQMVNRPATGTMAFATAGDYFALTPNTPRVGGEAWKDVQVLMHTPEELLATTQRGIDAMKGDSEKGGLSTAAFGLPVAGEASRAKKFADAHPELVERIAALGGLEGLEKDELPPRFLYPIKTDSGTRTLFGLMLKNFLDTSKSGSIGRLSLAINMFNSKSSNLVMDRMRKEGLSSLTKAQMDLMLGFVQSSAPRMFLSDMAETSDPYSTGHGDYPNALATADMYRTLEAMGIKYFIFANSDEFLWGADPTMIGVADRLIKKGYDGIVMVVPNSNNQAGGGVIRPLLAPNSSFRLEESMCLPANLSDGITNPSAVNTTFYILSTRALANATTKFLTQAPGLDIKTTDERGLTEQVGCLETWAGTEFTRNLKCAFVMAPRAGYFLGIKTLEHSHSDNVPPELKDFPNPRFANWSYERVVKYLANTYPDLLQRLMAGDKTVAYEIWRNGYSYLADPSITGVQG
jgi:hypothetical protein